MKIAFTLAALVFGVLLTMAEDRTETKDQWYTSEVQHEGIPLMLRIRGKLDFDTLQARYPRLIVVKHTFAQVQTNGLPKPDYNDSLAGFDHDLVRAFEQSGSGVTVIIETLGGRRNYYIYVSANAPVEDVKLSLSRKYPQHRLEWGTHDDAGWKFIRSYSEQYKFPKKG